MRIANGLLASVVALAISGAVHAPTARASTIVIVNLDGAGEGFNDPTVVAPVGGNPGTTVGAQRLYVFQYAANIWGSLLPSTEQINVQAQFDPLTCTATSAVLGSAGPLQIWRDFGGAPFPAHWYHSAEANKLSSSDLDGGTTNDINARFNSSLNGSPTCLGGTGWYLGVDGNEGTNIELLPVVLHELGHGLGFSTSTSGTTGNYNSSFPTIFDKFLYDAASGGHWDTGTTAAQRAASAISCGNLRWDGPSVTANSMALLGPRPNLHTTAPIVADFAVGEASFGPALSAGSVSGPVTLVNDGVASPSLTDACEPVPGSLAGQIALVDRGTCSFVIKVKNCQNAGAIGVIVADNAAGCPPGGLGGADPTITIPAVRVTQADGVTLKSNIVGLTATLAVNPSLKAGADNSGRVLMYSPNPFQSGSSVSHWDVSATPNLLMEPAINNNLSSNVDLTLNQMADIGWIDPATPIFVAPGHILAGTDGVRIEFYSGKALEGTWTSYRLNDGVWTAIGSPEIQGEGLLILKDTNVKPGQSYSYRLGAVDNTTNEQSFSETVTVTIPTTVAFGLEAAKNPAGRELTMAYTLGGVTSARLSLYNVAGRALKVLDLTGMGVGRHTVDLGAGLTLSPGTYFVRLVQGDRVATRPVVVQ